MRERIGEQTRPVLDGGIAMARMHKVEVVARIQPLALGVVDHEAHIGRHPGRLDGREVDAEHLGGRVGVAHLDGPDAGAGAEVDDVLRVVADGRKVQPVAAGGERHRVLHVLAVLLLVVVGQVVVALPELVVASPILEGVVAHRRAERGRRRAGLVAAVAGVAAAVFFAAGFDDGDGLGRGVLDLGRVIVGDGMFLVVVRDGVFLVVVGDGVFLVVVGDGVFLDVVRDGLFLLGRRICLYGSGCFEGIGLGQLVESRISLED